MTGSSKFDLSGISNDLLSDSSMSDCCLDFTSAAHFNADALVKIGDICYKPLTPPIPYFHVPVLLGTVGLSEQLLNFVDLKECDRLYVVSESLSTSNTAICALEKATPDRCQPITWDDTLDLCGATLVVGSPVWKSHMLSLICPQSRIYQWNETALVSLNSNRIRSKRYSVISSLSSNCSIGILVHSTLKVFADLALELAATSRSHGHPTYVVSVGRLSPMKLGNFPDIEAWVVVGRDFWVDKYETDPNRLGERIERFRQTEISAEPGPLALKVNSEFSSGALLSSAFQGISANVPETLSENTGEILKGAMGLPRSYTPMS
ncbi:putative diphthamide biosynthesis protein [Paramicrosporidium saccamoebae]|uniref:Putative diphthamide biosynthesis protein n=1 Tax=Paramicrosporidium saccamoebae TaxID=1246581 RepID=A0A2H9TG46_9FUNG|nr:putative diphthamide biosynthesis protein [Paramicrosporidium saccamoebae]